MTRLDVCVTELDALGLEEEEEGPSYLADLNKVPDFVDEAPQELGEVRHIPHLPFLSPQLTFNYLQTPERQEAIKQTS